jgi:small subunit ribosomal protein S18
VGRGGGNRDRDGDRKRGPKDVAKRGGKKKICIFCKDHIEWVDYKDVNLLRRFMSDRGKIRARRVSGNCSQHQRDVAVAIKTARELALLPYVQRAAAERSGGRGRPGRDTLVAPMPRAELSDDDASLAAVIGDDSDDLSVGAFDIETDGDGGAGDGGAGDGDTGEDADAGDAGDADGAAAGAAPGAPDAPESAGAPESADVAP